MRLKKLDYYFFELIRHCPMHAALRYSNNNKLNTLFNATMKHETDLNFLIYELKNKIFLASVLKLIEQKTLDLETFKLLVKTIIAKALVQKKSFKKQKILKKELLLLEVESLKIFEFLNTRDFVEIKNFYLSDVIFLNDEFECVSKQVLKAGRKYNFKKQYFVHVFVPCVTIQDGQLVPILLKKSNVPDVLDHDLNLQILFLKKLYPNQIFKNFVVYDIINFQRKILKAKELTGKSTIGMLFNLFFTIDTNSTFQVFNETCASCHYSTYCYLNLKPAFLAKEGFEASKHFTNLEKKIEVFEKTTIAKCEVRSYYYSRDKFWRAYLPKKSESEPEVETNGEEEKT